jgi:histidinol-phosphate aminotransferase
LTLTPYQPGKSIEAVKRQFKLDKITKLASNENPFGCSEQVLSALKEQESLAIYPDGYATNLRESLAEFLNVGQEELIFGNGSDNLIQMISRALLSPDSNTVMAAPTFSQYRHNAVIEGAEIREIPLTDGAQHDLDGMLAAIDDKTNVVWLCSPNNPTGTYIPENKLISFLEKVPAETLVVLDEAYYEYVVAEDYYDSISLARRFENLIVLRTFSKIYGLASLRIGYGIANPAIIKALEPAREPFNVNSLGQLAASIAIKDTKFIENCKTKNRQGLEQFYHFCETHHLSYYPSQTNFILVDFKVDGDQVFQYLLEKGYIVRSGKALGFPSSVRITVGSYEQNEGVLKAISEFLAEN